MKYISYLAIIPVLILVVIIVNGIIRREENSMQDFSIQDRERYIDNPKLKVTPKGSPVSRDEVELSRSFRPCLVIYNSKVYQIPVELFEIHEGGTSALVQGCGTDITGSFNMIGHSGTAKKLLDQLYYADLIN